MFCWLFVIIIKLLYSDRPIVVIFAVALPFFHMLSQFMMSSYDDPLAYIETGGRFLAINKLS
jgi:hypothetical protein